ncbi:MAG: hypothetical protein ACR2F8_04570 [Caulobacteraceae bacterium]
MLTATAALAVPSFAVQTGQPCSGCHIGGFGPQLTPFGREFKMNGYTLRTNVFNAPVSAMAILSYVRTNKDQPAPPPPTFAVNDNAAIDQIGLFVAGGLGSHFGAFIQNTYDGVARAFHWDNLDVRAVTTTTVRKVAMVFGLSLNNAPTVQDAFNTLPAWGFPYTSSSLAPHPGAAPLVGNLAQNTLGVTAYTWINSQFYAELGGYRSPSAQFLIHAGIDPAAPGNIDGIAPYGRVAYQKNYGDRNFELGAFAMAANIYPGHDQSVELTDHYDDVGLDGSYQLFAKNKDVLTLNGRYTYERQRLYASEALGLSSNVGDRLEDLRFDISYYFRDKIGLTVGAFDTWGSRDDLLYAANSTARPDSSGATFQIDGTPWGDGGSPLGPRFNMRVGVQYTAYLRFNGAGQNYDGFGRAASDNNTLRVFTWLAY